MAAINWSTIQFERETSDPRIGYLTINRPEVYNALNYQVGTELLEFIALAKQDSSLKVIIVKGAGEKAFVSGADIKEMSAFSMEQVYTISRRGQTINDSIEALDQVVIAAIHGFALGGGCELALACDIRVATSGSYIGIPEVTLGTIPGHGGTQRLARLIGKGRAKEMAFTGKPVCAQRAYEIGLVNHVVETKEELMSYCLDLAKQILKNGMYAVSRAKHAIDEGLEMDLRRGEEHEATFLAITFATSDFKEGVSAFLEKRPPRFSRS